jgi:hypothetical protein
VRRVDETNAEIPTIIFLAKDGSGADITAVKVTIDGELIADHLEGSAVSIDPGSHTFAFEAADRPALTKRLVILESQKERREAIVFGPTPAPLASPAPAAASPRPQLPSTPDLETSSGGPRLGAQRVLALVAGGIGVIGLGIGTAAGAVALNEKSNAARVCPKNPCTSPDGQNKWKDAASTGNVSTIGFIAGGAAVVGASLLWFTAQGPTGDQSVQVGLGLGAVQVKGTW